MHSFSEQDPDSKNPIADFVRSSDTEEIHDAICSYILSNDPGLSIKALDIIGEVLRQGHDLPQAYLETAISQLKEDRKNSLTVFLEYAFKYPLSQLGKKCIYILGEVAYYQRDQPDPRILQTLLEIAKKTLLLGIEESRRPLFAICDCSWYRKIPEAKSILLQALDVCIQKPVQFDGFSFLAGRILETLLMNIGDEFLNYLDGLLIQLDDDNELFWEIRYFLVQARMNQIIEASPSSLDSMIDDYSRLIETAPGSREFFFLGGTLEEIARIQGQDRDPRIPVLLLKALEVQLNSIGCELYSELRSIKNFILQKKVPEADKTIFLVLKELKRRNDVEKEFVSMALDILYANSDPHMENLYQDELNDLASEGGNQLVSKTIKEYMFSVKEDVS